MGCSIHFLCVYMAVRTQEAAVKTARLESPNEDFSTIHDCRL